MKILGITLFFMKYLGYRPDRYPSFFYRLLFPLNLLICTWFLVSSLWTVIDNIHDLGIATENLSQSILTTATAIKMVIVFVFHRNAVKLIADLQESVNESVKVKADKRFLSAKREYNIILKLYIVLITCASMSYPIMALVKPLIDYIAGNLKRESWNVPVSVYPLELHDSPWYEIIFILVTITAIVLDFNNLVLFTLYSGISLFICACFKRLNDMILGIDSKLEDLKYNQEIGKCVNFHNRIMTYIEEMEVFVQYIILLQLLCTSIIICFILFQLTALETDYIRMGKFFAFLSFELADFFFYCWYGNRITDESVKIGQSVYNMNWYDFKPLHRKSLLIMQIRSEKPCYITAMKFTQCSLLNFAAVTKFSFTILALVREVQDKPS